MLVVRDEKTGEISVVAGLSRDGTPKRAPAKAENTPDLDVYKRQEVRKRTDALDSLGNTTAATGKGFAIGSAALTGLALLASYVDCLLYTSRCV